MLSTFHYIMQYICFAQSLSELLVHKNMCSTLDNAIRYWKMSKGYVYINAAPWLVDSYLMYDKMTYYWKHPCSFPVYTLSKFQVIVSEFAAQTPSDQTCISYNDIAPSGVLLSLPCVKLVRGQFVRIQTTSHLPMAFCEIQIFSGKVIICSYHGDSIYISVLIYWFSSPYLGFCTILYKDIVFHNTPTQLKLQYLLSHPSNISQMLNFKQK